MAFTSISIITALILTAIVLSIAAMTPTVMTSRRHDVCVVMTLVVVMTLTVFIPVTLPIRAFTAVITRFTVSVATVASVSIVTSVMTHITIATVTSRLTAALHVATSTALTVVPTTILSVITSTVTSSTVITITSATDTIVVLQKQSLAHGHGADTVIHTQTFPTQGSLFPSAYHLPEAVLQRQTQRALSSPRLLPTCPLEWGAMPLDHKDINHNSGCRSREMQEPCFLRTDTSPGLLLGLTFTCDNITCPPFSSTALFSLLLLPARILLPPSSSIDPVNHCPVPLPIPAHTPNPAS